MRAGVDELPVPALEGKEAGLIAAAAGSTSIDDDDPIVVARALDAIAERTGNRAFRRAAAALLRAPAGRRSITGISEGAHSRLRESPKFSAAGGPVSTSSTPDRG